MFGNGRPSPWPEADRRGRTRSRAHGARPVPARLHGNPDIPMSWRFDRSEQAPGRSEMSAHIASICCSTSSVHLAGRGSDADVRPAASRTGRQLVDVMVDDQTEILADFDNGASGTILASWAGTGHKCDLGFELIGSRGSVSFSWQRSNELQFFDGTDPEDRQGFRTILVGPAHPVPTVFTPLPPRDSATPTRSRSPLATRCATLPRAGCCRDRPSSTACARRVSDAVIAAAASGSSVAVTRRAL